MSAVKEPRFFAPEFYETNYAAPLRSKKPKAAMVDDTYRALFADSRQSSNSYVAFGEASTEYLYYPKAPLRIKQAIPDVKLIAILRNPVERAFSAYCYQVRDGCEPLSFEDAIEAESSRICQNWRPGWFYIQSGYYFEQLKRYYQLFEPSQIKICLYEELRSNAKYFYADLFSFLEVEDNFEPDVLVKNASAIPAYPSLIKLMKQLKKFKPAISNILSTRMTKEIAGRINTLNMKGKPPLTLEMRECLTAHFRQDILNLQDLIQKDLSMWI